MEDPESSRMEKERALTVLQMCEEKLEVDPDDCDALFSKGTALAKLERYEESIMCLDRLTNLNPKYPGAWRLKSTIYRMMNEEEIAEECERMAKEFEEGNEKPM